MPINTIKARIKSEPPIRLNNRPLLPKHINHQSKKSSLPLLLNNIKVDLRHKKHKKRSNSLQYEPQQAQEIQYQLIRSSLNNKKSQQTNRSRSKKSKCISIDKNRPFSLDKWKARYSEKLDKFIMKSSRNVTRNDSDSTKFNVVVSGTPKNFINKNNNQLITKSINKIVQFTQPKTPKYNQYQQFNLCKKKYTKIKDLKQLINQNVLTRRQSKIQKYHQMKGNKLKIKVQQNKLPTQRCMQITRLAPWKLQQRIQIDEGDQMPYFQNI